MTDREEVGVDALATATGFARTENAAIAREAELAASDAAERIALRHYAAEVADEPLWPGSASTRVTAAAGLRAAHRLELAVHTQTHAYIKAARRDGMGWAEIGALVGLGADAAEGGLIVSEAAFGFGLRALSRGMRWSSTRPAAPAGRRSATAGRTAITPRTTRAGTPRAARGSPPPWQRGTPSGRRKAAGND